MGFHHHHHHHHHHHPPPLGLSCSVGLCTTGAPEEGCVGHKGTGSRAVPLRNHMAAVPLDNGQGVESAGVCGGGGSGGSPLREGH